ncbi:MAG: transposase, partial [Burkholderiales bacterium]|nr:transposase [Burkholderiales bacterium]
MSVPPMPNCTALTDLFPGFSRRKIELNFDGGDITGDAGLLLLRQVDSHLGLLSRIAPLLPDDRDPELDRKS